jgi:hypothetical protein
LKLKGPRGLNIFLKEKGNSALDFHSSKKDSVPCQSLAPLNLDRSTFGRVLNSFKKGIRS